MNRRDFLRGLAMSVTASGLILPTAAQALVLGDRYNRLVTALRGIVETSAFYRDSHGLSLETLPLLPGETEKVLRKRRDAEFGRRIRLWDSTYAPTYHDQFTEYMRILDEDFGDTTAYKVDPDGTMLRVAQVMTAPSQIDIFDEDELRKHEDIIVAITTMRVLLTKYRITTRGLKIDSIPGWTAFVDRYREIIMTDHRAIVDRYEENARWEERYGKRGLTTKQLLA